MTISFTQYIQATLVGWVLLSSCSHPVGYFHKSPGPAVSSMAGNTQPVPLATPSQPTAPSEASLGQIDTASNSVDAYVRNDRRFVENKKLGRHLNRIQHLMVATRQQSVSTPSTGLRKMNRTDRLIIRKLTKQIRQQRAAYSPEKAMVANRVQLVGSIVLLVGGLLLLILGSGTVAFIGLILSLVGAVGVIVSLFGV